MKSIDGRILFTPKRAMVQDWKQRGLGLKLSNSDPWFFMFSYAVYCHRTVQNDDE